MKLDGINSSKGRLEAHRRNMERPPPGDRRLDPRYHAPQLGERPGTLRCKCGNVYSPTAFAEHLAGNRERDAFEGVYTVGEHDEWLKSLKRQDAPPAASDDEAGELRVDADGSHWRGFENELKQRAWRCVSGPRAGNVELDRRVFLIAPTEKGRRGARVAEGADAGMF